MATEPNRIENRWTFAVAYLEQFHNDQKLGSASGFFWRIGEQTFLITNWHVVTGRHPDTRAPLAPHGGVPSRLTCSVFLRSQDPAPEGYFGLIPATVHVPLYGGGEQSRGLWLENSWGPTVDVVALDVTRHLHALDAHVLHVNELEGDAEVAPYVSQDVFIVGFPLGLVTGSPIPVWKRGTIATEPFLDADGQPKVFVDAATRSGMSGSVVVARHVLYGSYPTRSGGRSDTMIARRDQVLGVYSSRIGADHEKAQLGIVWKRRVLDDFASHPR